MSDASPTLSRRYTTMLVAALSLIALTCVALLVPVPYVMMRPGPAYDTLGDFEGKPMFTFDKGVKVYPTDGNLDFTTVSVTRADRNVSLGDAIKAYFGSDNAVVPKSLIYPDAETAEQSTQQGAAQLDSSKDSSRVAALRAAGFTVTGTPKIVNVAKDGAAAGKLKSGDLVTGIDGTKVDSAEALVKAVSTHQPGDVVTVSIIRKGAAQDVDITTKAAPDNAKVPRIGVTLGTKYTYPFTINNNVGRSIGGPSAGTMFALAIYDKLTPGSLTGGEKIAGTGEMAPDGTVGAIGGVRQKMAGAAHHDAKIFLVPAANCAEAADGDDFGLTLVKITKLDDAIDSLEALAKDPQAKVPTCS
ncbi:PDZ domain-containing protein [Aeromicrobium panaciterrae]|uniref:YlbL family protein n=1 Tax=Aeromicrobium panaciterrae TaxID=363861 RepID=UPI0031DF9968